MLQAQTKEMKQINKKRTSKELVNDFFRLQELCEVDKCLLLHKSMAEYASFMKKVKVTMGWEK